MSSENKIMFLMYNEAKKYLKEICPEGVDLDKYFDLKKSFKTKNDIFYILLVCLQDRQMADKVIGFTREDRQPLFKKILFDYDSDKILSNYDNESLLDTFSKSFTINNIESKNNMWRMYAKSIISSAKFMSKFHNINEFDNFVESYNGNEIDLPILLQKEIFGMGFALACHFLKELGYSNYAKPDIHIKEIFTAFDLSFDDDYSVFNAVLEMGNIVNDSAYNLDKLFWLICSGNFHMDNIMVGRHKDDFINMVKDKIRNNDFGIEEVAEEVKVNNALDSSAVMQITNMRKYKNNYGNVYGRITLDENTINSFLGNDEVAKVIIKYDATSDCLIIKKLNN